MDKSAETRRFWFDRSAQAGASTVRLLTAWQDIAGPEPPADPMNPADPSYDFTILDGAVREASARGLRVMLTVGVAPRWAEGADRPPRRRPRKLEAGPDCPRLVRGRARDAV